MSGGNCDVTTVAGHVAFTVGKQRADRRRKHDIKPQDPSDPLPPVRLHLFKVLHKSLHELLKDRDHSEKCLVGSLVLADYQSTVSWAWMAWPTSQLPCVVSTVDL